MGVDVYSRQNAETVVTGGGSVTKTFTFHGSLTALLDDVESSYIQEALETAKGNRIQAAKLLGVNYDWLKRRVKKRGPG